MMYDIWFLRCYNISVSLFVCSRFCVVTGCKNNENLTLSCSLHPKKWEQIIQNWKEWHKTFINYGVNIFGILKISWKMAELEGGYFVSELNGHPVHYVGGEREFYEWGTYILEIQRFLILYTVSLHIHLQKLTLGT